MIKRIITPTGPGAVQLRLDDQGQELTEDIPHFFDLILNDVTGEHAGCHARYMPSHWHREMEVFLLLKGGVQITIGSMQYEAREGEAYFINGGALHSFYFTNGPVQYQSFLFDPGIVAGAPGSVFDTVYVRPLQEQGPAGTSFAPGGRDAPFFADFARIFELCQTEPPAYEFAVRECLSRMLLAVREKADIHPLRQATAEQEERVKSMLHWMEDHLREPITLKDIAAHVSLCPRTCQKAFQKYLHCSPMEYLQRRRIFAAAQRLSLSDDPITAIALDCGFSSPSYFAKQFKSQTGTSPKAYRSAVQQTADLYKPLQAAAK